MSEHGLGTDLYENSEGLGDYPKKIRPVSSTQELFLDVGLWMAACFWSSETYSGDPVETLQGTELWAMLPDAQVPDIMEPPTP